MHQAIPYKTPSAAARCETQPELSIKAKSEEGEEVSESKTFDVRTSILENAVVVFARRGCCMCHVIRALLQGHGVNPATLEVDEGDDAGLIKELEGNFRDEGDRKGVLLQLPVVFVGGKVFGGLDKVMNAHIRGELVPFLREVGALWL